MRIGVAIDYGKYANASSLHLLAKKTFLELGKLMNGKKTFTVAAVLYEDIGMGDFNIHYDCICIPNMGGYKFPHDRALSCKNLVIGLSGIDEVVLGEQVYKTKTDWKLNKSIIEREIPKWKKYVDKIKFIHVPANTEKEQMSKYLKIPQDKIYVIPHGVDHEIFMPPSNKEEARKKSLGKLFIDNSPYFIHIGESNWARKNVFRMLEAYKIAREKGIKHKLIIVGRTDPVVYKKAQLVNGVTVLGYVSEEDLVALLQGADALIYPSLHEGFGLPLVEAMACGVPVITSNVFSPPEVVDNAGLFVDPYDVSDISNKIVEMSKNKSLRMELSKNALERSKRFSWQYVANTLLKLIEQNINHKLGNFDFSESIDLAAYRTLTTICQIKPSLYDRAQQDLLECNYSKIISWAINVGLEDPDVKDFLIPFRDWLVSHS